MMTWGRSSSKKRTARAATKELQNRTILLWLKRGYFEINSQLVEHHATISHANFWKKVRNLMPPAGATAATLRLARPGAKGSVPKLPLASCRPRV